MRLASYECQGVIGFGKVTGYSIEPMHSPALPDLKAWLVDGKGAQAAAPIPLSSVNLLPPIPNPGKILCVATNFIEADQAEKPRPLYPLLFTRFADSLVGHGMGLQMPGETEKFDFEGELAVIIGKPGRHIPEADAMDHVAGYTCFNDGTVRDWQKHSSQFTAGKNFYQSGSLGPWLVTRDEIPDVAAMQLVARVNGVRMQNIGMDRMIFDIPWLIAYCSRFTPLSAGDVIATGTPTGFGSSRNPPQFLAEGDLVDVEISGIGTLSNRVTRAPSSIIS